MIKAENLTKKYRKNTVIEKLSFEFHDGEKIYLKGVSGRGKTTLLRLIARLEKPDGGALTGYDKNDIAYMFQEPRLLPWENILVNTVLPVGTEYEIKAKELLCNLGLDDSLDKYPDELSGGMKQRVALARAILYNKKILLLDEPFASLDEITKEVACKTIKELMKDKTVVLVSHNEKDAELLFDGFYSFNL